MQQLGLAPGTVIDGEFEVVRPLSEGGMGAVYVVHQRSTQLQRALKVMLPALAANTELRHKFVREATIGSRIASEHIVQVVQAGIEPNTNAPWLVMELLQGEDMASHVRARGVPSLAVATDWLRQMGFAMSAAHLAGVVHRDLKPENVFLARSKRNDTATTVKILDFGIAKIVSEAGMAGSMAIGSPLWMAPEQASTGQEINPATDVWAMGLVAYFAFTGQSFWNSARSPNSSAVHALKEVCFDPIPPASHRAAELGIANLLPSGFDEWFARCVAREARCRFRDAVEASRALEVLFGPQQHHIANQATWAAPPVSPPSNLETRRASKLPRYLAAAVGALVGVATMVVLLFALRKPTPSREDASPPMAQERGLQSEVEALYEDERDKKNAAMAVDRGRAACESGDQAGCALVADAELRGRGSTENVDSGIAKLTALCEQESMLACAFLSSAYLDGKGVKKDDKRSSDLAEQACNAGVMRGCKVLGDAYQYGHGVIADPKRASELYRKACDGGNPRGCNNLGVAYMAGDAMVRDPIRAVRLYESACDAGIFQACMNVAGALQDGLGGAADPKRSAALYEQACKGGLLPACTKLALMRKRGIGVDRDAADASRLFSLACDGGDGYACNELGLAYEYGEGTAIDEKRSTELYQKACNTEYQMGCTNLGNAYLMGRGVTKDARRAAGLLKASCDAKELMGCATLSVSYATGDGVAPDAKRAFGLAKLACDGSNARGCGVLAVLYLEGLGVVKDAKKALELGQWSCSNGDGGACVNLGRQYERGQGVAIDKAQAKALYRQACDHGNKEGCAAIGERRK